MLSSARPHTAEVRNRYTEYEDTKARLKLQLCFWNLVSHLSNAGCFQIKVLKLHLSRGPSVDTEPHYSLLNSEFGYWVCSSKKKSTLLKSKFAKNIECQGRSIIMYLNIFSGAL